MNSFETFIRKWRPFDIFTATDRSGSAIVVQPDPRVLQNQLNNSCLPCRRLNQWLLAPAVIPGLTLYTTSLRDVILCGNEGDEI